MAIFETKSAFARRLGVNRSQTTRWAQHGLIVCTSGDRPLVNVEASLARLAEMGHGQLRPDVAARHKAARDAQQGEAMPDKGVRENAPQSGSEEPYRPVGRPAGGGDAGRAHYKRQQLLYETLGLQLQRDLARGQRLPRDQVAAAALGWGGALRAGIERIGDSAAARLQVAAGDPARQAAILDELYAPLRRETRQAPRRALRQLRPRSALAAGG